jgi:hypothetical protein
MDWIIGDVHGMRRTLDRLISNIEKQDNAATFWFVGDYCDRGDDSNGAVESILALGERARCVRGNHDDAFGCVLNGPSRESQHQGEDARVETLQWFMNFGIIDTLNSYGITLKQILSTNFNDAGVDALVAPVPQSHRDFYKNLPLWLETDDFFVCHARVSAALERPLAEYFDVPAFRQDALWSRFDYQTIGVPKGWSKTGYFGHTPVHTYGRGDKTPIIGPKIVLLDTCAFDGGGLTAMCHQTGEIITVK